MNPPRPYSPEELAALSPYIHAQMPGAVAREIARKFGSSTGALCSRLRDMRTAARRRGQKAAKAPEAVALPAGHYARSCAVCGAGIVVPRHGGRIMCEGCR